MSPGCKCCPPVVQQICITATHRCLAPFSGATVTVTQGVTTISTCTTDATGKCCVQVPAAGTYNYAVTATGYTGFSGSATVAAGATVNRGGNLLIAGRTCTCIGPTNQCDGTSVAEGADGRPATLTYSDGLGTWTTGAATISRLSTNVYASSAFGPCAFGALPCNGAPTSANVTLELAIACEAVGISGRACCIGSPATTQGFTTAGSFYPVSVNIPLTVVSCDPYMATGSAPAPAPLDSIYGGSISITVTG